MSEDDQHHGSGRPIAGGSATILITKKSEGAGALNIYVYAIMDAQMNIENGRFISAIY